MLHIELCSAPDASGEAHRLREILRSRRVECRTGESGKPGAMVLLLSPGACESEYVRSSVNRALRTGAKVFPLFLRQLELPDWLSFSISNHQWLNAGSGRFEAAAHSLAGKLLLEHGERMEISTPSRRSDDLPPGVSGFVGRKPELRQLAGALAPGDKLALAGVRGEAGIGKTTLVSRFIRNDRRGSVRVSAGSEDHSVDYKLWARFITGLAGEASSPEELRGLLSAAVDAEIRSEALNEAVWLLPLELTETPPRPAEMNDLALRVGDFLAELVLSLSSSGAPLIFLDNIHWADRGSLEMLGHILKRVADGPVRMVLAYRPLSWDSDPVRIPVGGNITPVEIDLSPLSRDESAELLCRLMGSGSGNAEDFSTMAGCYGGKPLYLELLAGFEGGDSHPPEDGNSLLLKRFGRLPEDERRILLALAVLGGEAAVPLVLAVASVPPGPETDRRIQNDDFLLRTRTSLADVLSFRHDLLRHGIYRWMDRGTRQGLHFRAAVLLEENHREDPRFSGEISVHWESAGNPENALSHAMTYLEHINSIFHNTSVLDWAEKAEKLIGRSGADTGNAPVLARALAVWEDALSRLGRIPEEEQILQRLNDVALEFDLPDMQAYYYCSRGKLRQHQGRYDEAVELVGKGAEIAESRKLKLEAAKALNDLGSIVSDFRDRAEEAEQLYLRSLSMFEELNEGRSIAVTRMHLGILFRETNRFREAIENYRLAAEYFRETGYIQGEGAVFMNLAAVYSNTERVGDALEAHEKGIQLISKTGDIRMLAIGLGNRANDLLRIGKLEEAVGDYSEAIRLHVKSDNRIGEYKARCNYADCLRKQGLSEEALEQLDRAMELNSNTGDHYWRARMLEGRGRALLECRRHRECVETLESCLLLAEERNMPETGRRSLNGLAMEALVSGRPERALEYCAPAACEPEGKTPVYEEVESLLIMSRALLALQRRDEAVRLAERAALAAEVLRRPLLTAASDYALGKALGGPRGDELLGRAGKLVEECGYGRIFWFSELRGS